MPRPSGCSPAKSTIRTQVRTHARWEMFPPNRSVSAPKSKFSLAALCHVSMSRTVRSVVSSPQEEFPSPKGHDRYSDDLFNTSSTASLATSGEESKASLRLLALQLLAFLAARTPATPLTTPKHQAHQLREWVLAGKRLSPPPSTAGESVVDVTEETGLMSNHSDSCASQQTHTLRTQSRTRNRRMIGTGVFMSLSVSHDAALFTICRRVLPGGSTF